VGDMMAYLQYAMHAIMSFLMLSVMFIMIPRSAVSADRIAEVIDTSSSIRDPAAPREMRKDLAGVVEFRSVSFRYPGADEDVLSDISFTARPGTTTALIGPTGCGKSTLVHLVPRFYDVTSGSILVSGVDVRELAQTELRQAIGFVPQKAVLRTGTVADNIRAGKPDASDRETADAARIAQAAGFIEKMEEGYASPVSEGGANFSGGQKQRLSIARAVVKKPSVYIFDDSFSALDAATDAKLRTALDPVTEHATVIVVSQRIHTIMHADSILVLDNGRIVGSGTHDELLETCGLYREIASSQLAMEVSE
ncbi:MAG TPA: ABC transporter ATP-binding protein, partial [Treponemataceae bacterium]|nr:ABC transporter ATP-binding protein [Treponemataceae bacterium]